MKLNRTNVKDASRAPERIIQFGEGNFLRAFVDWMIQEMNDKADFNSSVVVVQPIDKGMVDVLNSQDGLYTLVAKGLKNGQPVKDVQLIKSISRGINPYAQFDEYLKLAENPDMRFVISNTTEAGIAFNERDKADMVPPSSYPAKLTVLLHHRFKTFNGDAQKGLIIMPCELIDRNGDKLKKCVNQYCELWSLGADFTKWVNEACVFTNTLVDRIVPGYNPETAKEVNASAGYEDSLVVEGEQFHLWVIEGSQWIKNEFPADKAGLNVLFVDDVTPYRTRKVRILNGPHTVLTPVAYLSGVEYVREAVEHPVLGKFIHQAIYNEIVPALNMPEAELVSFANDIVDRFRNPFVKHAVMSISLNSVSKYKARVLDTVKEYLAKKGQLPNNLVVAMAALIAFYRGTLNGNPINVQDEAVVMEVFNSAWAKYDAKQLDAAGVVNAILTNTTLWGEDLTQIKGYADMTACYLSKILADGMFKVVEECVNNSGQCGCCCK
ncbi:tagaturonate reductase [Breznakibacter xylanolyticus]|uniref:Tagaturonate reductase n=1 Tax=Breznakibacter xylanolyticus TaxID=990 RepID=A0A2W7NIY8_9BACT|nr:tagaturonate reductase [Breznakibacter xylanolyticus]PZX11242.1 tagaturonate reductase [Breznakibacter xylanolyticus]